MSHARSHSVVSKTPAGRVVISKLEAFLRTTRLRKVHFAQGSVPPPPLAYVTHFPRLSITLAGCHKMELACGDHIEIIKPVRGHAVFVPGNTWNRPDWTVPVQALTFLFGTKQIGISLVQHKGKTESPIVVLKTSIHGTYDGLTNNVLGALLAFAAEKSKGPLASLLTEALLHSCLRLLKQPQKHRSRKAVRSYESICLYLQENFQSSITRESVAKHFGVAPNHVSRLFRQEGSMRFNDYLNLVRVNRAKFMLRNYRAMTLKEISANCGYSDTAYFCRIFKKISKMTPTEYRGSR